MAKKRRKVLPLNYPLPLPDFIEKGDIEERLKSYFKRIEVSQKQRKRALEGFRVDYEKTLNPLAAWDAFLFSQEQNLPVPAWVLEYLRSTAKLLMRADNTTRDLGWCFGLDSDGGPGPWKTYRSHRLRLEALAHVITRINQGATQSIDDICEEAAQLVAEKWGTEINFETVKQWFYRSADEWKKPPVSGCVARVGNPTILTKKAHGLFDGDIVEISGATGRDAHRLNGRVLPVCYATDNTFAIEVDTTGAEPMGENITATP